MAPIEVAANVALKTLPSALASDKDRLVRFEREAKLLAGLNHPNIAAVYSLDEFTRSVESGARFLPDPYPMVADLQNARSGRIQG